MDKLKLTTWNSSRILINRINIHLLMKHVQELLTSSRGQDFILFCLSQKDGRGNRRTASA